MLICTAVTFPYEEFRPFQRELYQAVHRVLTNGGRLLINAPTGLGKTAAVMAAVVQYITENGGRVHYVVRTRNELTPPLRELARIRKRGLDVNYLVIKSRQDMCCYRELKRLNYLEFLAECNFLKKRGLCKYYPPRDVEQVGDLCQSNICPYEYAKERFAKAPLVLSTYYYIFGGEKIAREKVVIVDESHALLDAVVNIHTAKVSIDDIKAAHRECRRYGFQEVAKGLYDLLNLIKKKRSDVEIREILSPLQLEEALWEIARRKAREGKTPYTPLLAIREFNRKLRERKLHVEIEPDSLVAMPTDPERIVTSALEGAHGVVYVSGTLPVHSFAEILGITHYDVVDIPFSKYIPRENYLSVVDMGVTTRFQERGEEMYLKIAERLATIINMSPRGVLAVFPSYQVMRGVRKYLKIAIPHWYEDGEVELENLPEKFFGGVVAGGRYAEGVEYVKNGVNLLSIVVIVGVPYPEPSPYLERRVETLKPRLKDKAWSAVYQYRAVVQVRQAVGRLFRSPRDEGVLIFLDRRYVEVELWESLKDVLAGSLLVNHVGEVRREVEYFLLSRQSPDRYQKYE